MSLYNIKKIPLLSVLKIYSIIMAVFAVIISVAYVFMLKMSLEGFEISPSPVYFLTIGAVTFAIYLIVCIAAILLFVWLYNILASKIGGIEMELEAKE
ncbi:MAG: hypothetical protein LBH29_07165 [Elusimicrobiota bacterium]|jgi:hypothetical protein|nr:hypothetical protein [Elusimicrobiota bacterium]